jgi:hypothetical protein
MGFFSDVISSATNYSDKRNQAIDRVSNDIIREYSLSLREYMVQNNYRMLLNNLVDNYLKEIRNNNHDLWHALSFNFWSLNSSAPFYDREKIINDVANVVFNKMEIHRVRF